MVVAVSGLDGVPAGTEVLIDGMRGTIGVARSGRSGRRGQTQPLPGGEAEGAATLTADGFPVAILANAGRYARAAARETPASNRPLQNRTLALNRVTEPTVAEQTMPRMRSAGRSPAQGRHPHTGRGLGQTAEIRRPSR